MRKLFIFTLLCVSAFFVHLSPASAQDFQALQSQQGLTDQEYDNGAFIPYFSHYKDWSSGISLTNLGADEGFFTIAVWDQGGNAMGKGTFRVKPNASRAGSLKDLIQGGKIPAQGFVVIFGTETFEGARFSANKKVGYDEFHFASQSY
jgi:hypothetical protein